MNSEAVRKLFWGRTGTESEWNRGPDSCACT